ncbi:MAG: divalent metal cation transporter, partial [Gemmatimonadaceae bacterium]
LMPSVESESEGPAPTSKTAKKKGILRSLGPGIVAGAADDDPSGIATYSITGAQFGTALLWTSIFLWPLMAAVQAMCARIGMVTGRGLVGALRTKYPRWIILIASLLLFLANAINIGADLAGMSDALEMLTNADSHLTTVLFGVGIAWATIRFRYATMAKVLKWMALVLFAYVVTAIRLSPDWGDVARATFVPVVPSSKEAWATLVAILGTSISPYLFFWQASQEVEEEKSLGRLSETDRRGATPTEIRHRKIDVGLGTLVSNIAMFFIILTTALTLHKSGITSVSSSREVASALKPLAGSSATLLYTLGILGTGVLAIPVLAGSAAYAFAEIFDWRQGMDEGLRGAPAFYAVLILALAFGVGLDALNVNPVRALYLSAVVNGLLAPPLLIAILFAASDRRLMLDQPSSWLGRLTVGTTVVVMVGASIAMFVL